MTLFSGTEKKYEGRTIFVFIFSLFLCLVCTDKNNHKKNDIVSARWRISFFIFKKKSCKFSIMQFYPIIIELDTILLMNWTKISKLQIWLENEVNGEFDLTDAVQRTCLIETFHAFVLIMSCTDTDVTINFSFIFLPRCLFLARCLLNWSIFAQL